MSLKVQRKAKIQSKSTPQTLPQKLEGFVGDGRELSVIVIGQNLRPGIGPSVVLGLPKPCSGGLGIGEYQT